MLNKETESTYYERNKERQKKNAKEYYKHNSAKVRERVIKYNNNHKKDRLIKEKERYNKDKKKKCLKVREYRQNNKEKIRKYSRKWYHQNKEIETIRSCTRNAFKDLKIKCEICGSRERLQFHHPKPYRFDSFLVLCWNCHLKEHGKEKVL